MIDSRTLSLDLSRRARSLEADLRGQGAADEQLTQLAVAWVLGTVFVRFAADNGLTAGPAPTDRDSLLSAFDRIAATPAWQLVFDREHDPRYQVSISQDAATDLIAFWYRRDGSGSRVYDFTDPDLKTDFLVDVYENISESAHKEYALVHTPKFVADFILDHTLLPAIEEFGYDTVRVIDPVCGSGQFVLGAFERLLEAWTHWAPELSPGQRVLSALESVHGVDINPFAATITRFRLLMRALQASGLSTFDSMNETAWKLNIATGDALLDLETHAKPLRQGGYHVVVGNPPYIAVKDRLLDEEYRERYDACSGKYSLTVPFAQQFFRLSVPAEDLKRAGYVGYLTANSFMKRDFGRKLIEDFYAQRVNLTRVVDTSGAFIPGHGTPTVILIGRNCPPVESDEVFTVLGVHGEPELPKIPSQGLVWQSIERNSLRPNQSDEWTESLYLNRRLFGVFPWILTNTRTADVVKIMSDNVNTLDDSVVRIGYFANTGSDDIFTGPAASFRRLQTESGRTLIPVITGSEVRDWAAASKREAFFPLDEDRKPVDIRQYPGHFKRLWPYRNLLGNRPNYSTRSFFEDGRVWYDWHFVTAAKDAHPWSITFSWVATHAHFAILRERAAPLQSAPVIKLSSDAKPQDYIELTSLLNSSAICFWLKQHSNSKGRSRANKAGNEEPWMDMYEFTASRLAELPLPSKLPAAHTTELDCLAQELTRLIPSAVSPTREHLAEARQRWETVRSRMIALQEELDWEVYDLYGLLPHNGELLAPPETVPPLNLGERAFEIVLARKTAEGDATEWFHRHGSTPVTELPEHWPPGYRDVVQRRINAIEEFTRIGTIERPEFKRRWVTDGWDKMQEAALRDWLLDRCEAPALWFNDNAGTKHPRPLTVNQLAGLLGADDEVVEAAEIYAPGRQLTEILADLVGTAQVPYLAALRYRESGLRKRSEWEQVWQLQRQEDEARSSRCEAAAIEQRDEIPVPSKYSAADFLKVGYWSLRGKFDVPNERFISFPNARFTAGADPLIGWAGWDYTERAQVLIDLISERRTDSCNLDRDWLIPLLGGLRETLPWLRQWNPELVSRYAAFLAEGLRVAGLTESDLAAWRPAKPKRGRPRKTAVERPSSN
ncbi:BREX-2 system adenine-specific DNA-methyltransferase PglX [Saccharopolyspora sp. K220]|uniref:BREX-2 system adenine-specific DNA-methyltransferase PglX n=1 Tax=Saccharopolyspora soli TaxID=2926618 RepID=UPI001F573241|nr:BREX-2 system adenine-specific DNA-methyltransferase PglX [Saccharopolyspora soli]MCI2422751.1 BREX-2 system adenine-specific DNA-methyltransferase PglX [Saccharopolyspora soli]